MAFSTSDLSKLAANHRECLLRDTLPFWLPRALDSDHGGYLTARDREGRLLDDDKSVWQQGRFAWLLSTLYTTLEPREEWLEAARSGIDFLRHHCIDHQDGRFYFQVTRDGRPLRKRRYFYSEAFACMAFAGYANAARDAQAANDAKRLWETCLHYYDHPEALPAKNESTRPAKTLGVPMILLNVAQQLRETLKDISVDSRIRQFIDEIRRDFVKPEIECVMEQVSPEGGIIDHFDGRTLNPGHAIECAWFILHEAKHQGRDPDLVRLGTNMVDWMWARGWDESEGGLFYFRDVYDRPVQEYWHDMKFWWPHCEAIIATLLAYTLTGEERFRRRYEHVIDYANNTFADPEFGEWFGYAHRDGTLSSTIKGNLWKGPFHLPRMQWYCWLTASTSVTPL